MGKNTVAQLMKTKLKQLREKLLNQEVQLKSEINYDENMLEFLGKVKKNLQRANLKFKKYRERSISLSRSRLLSLSNKRIRSKKPQNFLKSKNLKEMKRIISKGNLFERSHKTKFSIKAKPESEANLRIIQNFNSEKKDLMSKTVNSPLNSSMKDENNLSGYYNSPKLDKKYLIKKKTDSLKNNSHYQLTFNKNKNQSRSKKKNYSQSIRVPYLNIDNLDQSNKNEIILQENIFNTIDLEKPHSVRKHLKKKMNSFTIFHTQGTNRMNTERSLMQYLDSNRDPKTNIIHKKNFEDFDDEKQTLTPILNQNGKRRNTLSYFEPVFPKKKRFKSRENNYWRKDNLRRKNSKYSTTDQGLNTKRTYDRSNGTKESSSLIFNLKKTKFRTEREGENKSVRSQAKTSVRSNLRNVLKEIDSGYTSKNLKRFKRLKKKGKRREGRNKVEAKENCRGGNVQQGGKKKNRVLKVIDAGKFDKRQKSFRGENSVLDEGVRLDLSQLRESSEVIFDINDYIISSESKGEYI